MKFQVVGLCVLLALACSAERPKRGVLAAAAPIAAAYYAPSYYAAPSPVIARASRIVGSPGFAARYVSAVAYNGQVVAAAAPYTLLIR